ncbi:MAG: hypothetical protein HQK70_03510 [Desulfamplus sp.]|nr:hypothetical protein [Desulfamplus sp.]
MEIEPVFCCDHDWKANACLNFSDDPIHLYAKGYKEAGDLLVEYVLVAENEQDTLIYPIVFLYRQYIELRLKEIIREGRILLEEGNDFPKHHKIFDLWCLAKKIILKSFDNEEESPDLKYAEHVIREFSQIDPDSFSFRYPTTKNGDKTLDGVLHINIRRLATHVEALSKDLESISIGISVYRDWQKEMWSSCY